MPKGRDGWMVGELPEDRYQITEDGRQRIEDIINDGYWVFG